MKKFINHIDHVAWVSRLENLDKNIAQLETLTNAKLTRFEHRDNGYVLCVNWEAGLEVLAPYEERTEINRMMHDWLDTRGEGVIFVTFGVDDLDKHKARLEAVGIEVGPLFEEHAEVPWKDQLVLRERIAGNVMNSLFVLGDIEYADDVIPFGDA